MANIDLHNTCIEKEANIFTCSYFFMLSVKKSHISSKYRITADTNGELDCFDITNGNGNYFMLGQC